MKKQLIVLEGIDCSGKTSLAQASAKRLNFRFEHEPTFSSSYADSLNFKKLNAYQREFHFMLDRYKHQKILNKENIILDRYRLTGAVYASAFGPEALPMVHAIYGLTEFKKPDLTIFVDIEPEDALKLNALKKGTEDYNPKLNEKTLQVLRETFLEQIVQAQILWGEKIVVVDNIIGQFDSTLEEILSVIKKYILT